MVSREAPMTEAAYKEFYRATYEPFRVRLGRALRQAREDAGLSRAELAALTYTPEVVIAGFEAETGDIEPTLGYLVLASRLLERPLTVLIARAEGGGR